MTFPSFSFHKIVEHDWARYYRENYQHKFILHLFCAFDTFRNLNQWALCLNPVKHKFILWFILYSIGTCHHCLLAGFFIFFFPVLWLGRVGSKVVSNPSTWTANECFLISQVDSRHQVTTNSIERKRLSFCRNFLYWVEIENFCSCSCPKLPSLSRWTLWYICHQRRDDTGPWST